MFKGACLVVVVALACSMVGCQASERAAGGDIVSPGAVSVCTSCGEAKGTDSCCRPGAAVCSCGMNKGSIGCCRIPQGSSDEVLVCTSCGEFKGTAACCKDAELCTGCGLHKGSPGCCKIDT